MVKFKFLKFQGFTVAPKRTDPGNLSASCALRCIHQGKSVEVSSVKFQVCSSFKCSSFKGRGLDAKPFSLLDILAYVSVFGL